MESDDGESDSDPEERVRTCEKEYIETEVVTRDDETIEHPLSPRVVERESRRAGEYFELETGFGVTREPLNDDEPPVHLDYHVTASYLVDGEDVYRTEGGEAEGDPRDGVELDC